MQTYQQMMNEISKNQFASLYLVQGTEDYFIQNIEQALINNALSPDEIEMNYVQIDLREHTVDDLIFEATSYPFFGERKLIFANYPEFLTGQKSAALEKNDQEALIEYLNNPADFSVVVFFAPYEKLDKRKKITKTFLNQVKTIDVSSPKPAEIERFFKNKIQESGYQMDADAFQLFMQLTGGQLSQLMHEFEKIITFQGPSQVIKKQTVEQLVPKNLEYNIFELNHLVFSGQTNQALDFFQELLLQKEDPIKIIALLISEFRLLLQVKILQEQNLGQRQISEQLKVHWYRVKLAMEKTRAFSVHQLAAWLEELIDLDYQIKTGKVNPVLGFEWFVLKFNR